MSIIDFRSDNTGRAAPELLAWMVAANQRTAAGYGGDEWTTEVQERFSALFETKVRVFPVATGTAANAISLGAITPPYGAIYCSEQAHISGSEANAAGFFGGGARLLPLASAHAKVNPEALAAAIDAQSGNAHYSKPSALSLTQVTELGTVYSLAEVRALTAIARGRGLKVHMDGARFANAIARLGCSPADLTWRSGVDILSFGVTKNGGAACDAIVVFDRALDEPMTWHLQRAGQVFSKMRFVSSQLLGYLNDDLWLRNARAANAAGARLDAGLRAIPGVRMLAPIEANLIFLDLPTAVMDGLERDGVKFFRRSKSMARFVCRFDVTGGEVDALLASLRRHLGADTQAAAQ
jgi:threonine aldolase